LKESRKDRLGEIDGLRAVAITLVLLFHYTKEFFPAHTLLSFGWSGVNLFFVISGFVLYLTVQKNYASSGTVRYLPYLRNRLLRIVPAYYVSVLTMLVLFGGNKILTAVLPMHLSFMHIFNYDIAMSVQPLYWTLAVEVQFYLFLILAARLFTGKNGTKWILSLIGLTLAYRALFQMLAHPASHAGLVLGNILPGRLAEFAYGMLIAKMYVERGIFDTIGKRAAACAVLSVLLIAFCWLLWLRLGDAFLGDPFLNVFYYPLVGLGYALLLLAVITLPSLRLVMAAPAVTFIGIISYSIYLWHGLPLMALKGEMTGAKGFAAALALMLLVSTASYFLIERTFLKLKSR
jgi:peptidoglycan/LPS O-acetylase OafA/YrhL